MLHSSQRCNCGSVSCKKCRKNQKCNCNGKGECDLCEGFRFRRKDFPANVSSWGNPYLVPSFDLYGDIIQQDLTNLDFGGAIAPLGAYTDLSIASQKLPPYILSKGYTGGGAIDNLALQLYMTNQLKRELS